MRQQESTVPHGAVAATARMLALAAVLVAANAAADAPAIARLRYAADTGANLLGPGGFVARRDYVDDDLAASRTRQVIPGLPDTVILRDFHVEANGDLLFALDVGTTLGGTHFRPADVIRYHAGGFTREFDAQAAGIPADVHCDGVARRGVAGALLLSFDRSFALGGSTVLPADVVAVSGATLGAKVLDATALSLPPTLNVDAVDSFGTRDYLLVSFDRGGRIGGLAFAASDVLQVHLTDGGWSRRYDLRAFSDRWNTANLDGLAAVNDDSIFQDDFQ